MKKMNKKYQSIIYLLLTVLLLAACTGQTAVEPTADNNQVSLYVAPFWAPCVGVAPTICMQVRETTDGQWTNFFGKINGFDYEPGYSYKLLVKKETVENPPADGSSIRWTLVEEQSKSAVEMPKIDLTGTKWVLVSNSGTNPLPDHEITLEFQEDGRMGGSAGCNSYGADYALQGVSFVPGMIISTMMACEEPIMQHESSYLSALQSMQYFQLDTDQLLLVNPDGHYLLFKSK